MSEGSDYLADRLPRVHFTTQAPVVPQLPHVPFVGCFPGDGSTYVGRKFGNRPDFLKLNHIKQLKKDMIEYIEITIAGKLEGLAKEAAFEALRLRYLAEKAQALDEAISLIGEITEELEEVIARVNSRIEELNSLRGEIENTPQEARSILQQHLLTLYNECFGKLEAKATCIQGVIDCLGVF